MCCLCHSLQNGRYFFRVFLPKRGQAPKGRGARDTGKAPVARLARETRENDACSADSLYDWVK